MKRYQIILTGIVLIASFISNKSLAQEYDDLYFTAKDRKKNKEILVTQKQSEVKKNTRVFDPNVTLSGNTNTANNQQHNPTVQHKNGGGRFLRILGGTLLLVTNAYISSNTGWNIRNSFLDNELTNIATNLIFNPGNSSTGNNRFTNPVNFNSTSGNLLNNQGGIHFNFNQNTFQRNPK